MQGETLSQKSNKKEKREGLGCRGQDAQWSSFLNADVSHWPE